MRAATGQGEVFFLRKIQPNSSCPSTVTCPWYSSSAWVVR